mgnify:CR=1 FL=1
MGFGGNHAQAEIGGLLSVYTVFVMTSELDVCLLHSTHPALGMPACLLLATLDCLHSAQRPAHLASAWFILFTTCITIADLYRSCLLRELCTA